MDEFLVVTLSNAKSGPPFKVENGQRFIIPDILSNVIFTSTKHVLEMNIWDFVKIARVGDWCTTFDCVIVRIK